MKPQFVKQGHWDFRRPTLIEIILTLLAVVGCLTAAILFYFGM